MMYMDKTKRFMLRLTPAEHKRLKIEAIERNTSVSELIRIAVNLFIEKDNVEEKK